MMTTSVNRVLLAFNTWEERKKEADQLLRSGVSDSATLARLQLVHLRDAAHRLRGAVRPDEKPFMLLLDNQVAKLEKKLFPNLFLRMFSKLKDRLFNGPALLKREQRQRDENLARLKSELTNVGLGSFAGSLEKHLELTLQQAAVPLNCQLGPEMGISLTLRFDKNVYGDFKLDQINASLIKNGESVRSQVFELTEWPGLKAKQILNLLEGPAVSQQYTDAIGHQNQRWVELGANGIQYYDSNYGFDIRSALQALPAITQNKEDLALALENGQ